jgi:hypothetical protein
MSRDGTTPLVRTDFSVDAAWLRTVAAVRAPGLENYEPTITPVEDRGFENLDADALAAAYDDCVGYVLLADRTTMTTRNDPTVVYVDMYDEPGRAFRCAVPEVAAIEVNLSIANVDFEEFTDAAGADGVYRGFGA